MSLYAIVIQNRVTNVINAEADFEPDEGVIINIENENPKPAIGWLYDGANFTQSEFVPERIQRYQMMVALEELGQLNAIETYMANPARTKREIIDWQNSPFFARQGAFVLGLIANGAITDTQADNFFIKAARIPSHH